MAVSANGKIKKKTYCPNCFALIEWDDPNDEVSINGHRHVICPSCGAKVDVDAHRYLKIEDEAEEESSDSTEA